MSFDPFAQFAFQLAHRGRTYAGNIRPWPRSGHQFPEEFTVTVGSGMFFAHIRYDQDKGWTSGGGAADPDVIRAIGNYIQVRYQ